MATVPTHRFTLSPTVERLLDALSKEKFHEMLRSAADERWQQFLEENADTIEAEGRRLAADGFQGDLSTKMYRSARYYRSRRQAAQTNEQEAGSGEPAQRREYIATPPHLLALMDQHVRDNCFGASPMTPAQGWAAFQEQYSQAVALALQSLTGTERLTAPEAQEKVKKAYKNRQYLQRQERKAAALRQARLDAIPDE